ADNLECVHERGEDDDRRAMLVVMHDRDVEGLLESVFDLEAAWRADVFEVDAAEAWCDRLDGPNDGVGLLRRQTDGPAVNVGELAEEHALAFHDRQRRFWT